jgi:aspartyl-tRNA(Asn)/glutamyl-tRNA(Gln) amidotransferase subunit A
MQTMAAAAADLAAGRTTARQLVEAALARIAEPGGEGARAFIRVHAEAARAMADGMDALRRAGGAPGPYAGIPVGIKDLCDIAGEPTPAGSAVLADAPPAAQHAPVLARMLGAGLIPVGRTNMTEFAFSGLGINPHYGTPASPWDRATRRIPGGSSSGTAVAVADGMAFAGLGTDTGGSCRVPAAYCGIVGYKPTARRVPIEGILPLAPSLDSVGPLARSVACCAAVDAIMAGEVPRAPRAADVSRLHLAIPTTLVLDGLDATVAASFERACARLAAAGARISHIPFPVFTAVAEANRLGLAGAEAYAWHRVLLARAGDRYDPRIKARIVRGADILAADYLELMATRRRLIAEADAATAPYDALLLPTCPILPAPIAALDDEAEYNRVNLLSLRNTTLGNFLDRCAISLPCHRAGEAPVGLMLMGETMGDAKLFAIAAGVEAALAN